MILRKKIIFFPILGGGGGRRVRLPWIRPWYEYEDLATGDLHVNRSGMNRD
jgi:hypothetical protein